MLSERYQQNIRDFFALLRENNIPFSPVCGTLLGAYRDHSPIQWDTDVDIGIHIKYKDKVETLIANSTAWQVYSKWRREMAVIKFGFTSLESKIDIFFLEPQGNKLYLYSYRKNSVSGIWNVEWRIGYEKDSFDKLTIPIAFLPNLTIYLPEKTEELLETQYGDWRNPNPNWDTYDTPLYDKDYREVAIIIPTMMRHNALTQLVESIKKTQDPNWYRLYIADQSNYDVEKEQYYNQLRQEGHKIFYLPFNCGLSYSRNRLVESTIEPYVMTIDDDFIFTEHTDLENFIRILQEDKNLGCVGGDLKRNPPYHWNLRYQQNEKTNNPPKLYYISCKESDSKLTSKTVVQKPISYLYCDIVLNFAMYKREVFNTFGWDENLKLVEHSDFFLRLLKETNWRVAHTSSVVAIHDQNRTNESYTLLRSRLNCDLYYQAFLKKWNLRKEDIIILK